MHAVIAFAALPLFLGALLSDWAYFSSYQIQWLNFTSWLTAGGLVLLGLALLLGTVAVLRSRATHRRGLTYLLLLLATFVVGFMNALIHAKDGWAVMPAGLFLSVVVAVLAATSSTLGLTHVMRSKA